MPTTSALAIQVTFDQRQLRSVDSFLGTYQGVELAKRIDLGLVNALRPVVVKLKMAEQNSGIHNRTGAHLRSIKMRKPKKRYGEAAARTVGPTDRKAHLLLQGHVTRDGHSRAQAFPYLDEVISSETDDVVERVSDYVWGIRP